MIRRAWNWACWHTVETAVITLSASTALTLAMPHLLGGM